MSTWLKASVPAVGVDLVVKRGRLAFDEQWSPYVRAELVVGLDDASQLAVLDPRARPRIVGEANDGYSRRPFDLLLRGRTYDYATGEATLTLDCDEALLHDGALVQSGPWVPTSGSVRFLVKHALASIGAQLQPGVDDATVDPASSAWAPGLTVDEYLKPVLTAAGLRLYCDELRRWYLVDADATSAGYVDLAGDIVSAGDEFDLDADDSYYDSVVVEYAWTDTAGKQQQVFDTAGTPSGLYDISGAGSAPFKVALQLARNAVMQSAVQLPTTGEWYVTQAIDGSNGTHVPYDTTYINRLTPSGAYIDGMMLIDGGHGTSIAVEPASGANKPYIWHAWADPGSSGKQHDLVRFPYAAGTYTRDEVAGLQVMPKFTSARVLPSFDYSSDLVAFRTAGTDSETYTRRQISDVKAGRDLPLGQFTVPTDLPTMQGFVVVGDALLEYTGAANEPSNDPALLSEYAWDGRLVDQVSTSPLGRLPDGSYPGGRHEPESAELYRDPLTNQAYVDLGVTLNTQGNYSYSVYRLKLGDAVNAAPTRVLHLTYPTPPPAPGAAARILRRRQAHAGSVPLEARADLSATPTMALLAQLPGRGAKQLAGAVSSVEFRYPENRMSLGTRDLVQPAPMSWLAVPPGTAWGDVRVGVSWTTFDPVSGGASPFAWVVKYDAGVSWLNAEPAGVSWARVGQAPLETWSAAAVGVTWAQLPVGKTWNTA